VELPSGPPQVKIEAHRPDGLELARQALQRGDTARAIAELEALYKTRSRDPHVLRWLARAYLAAGDQQRLRSWLPEQLAQLPYDSELRLLLARSQLQAGDARAAVATLEQSPPRLEQEPNYFALLAAVYQQTEQWQKSADLYRQMIALRPSQATWQLGLAIALEQLDQPAQAGKHYRLALQGVGLDDSSRRFANERGNVLGN
jgi:MSHA biogenesis protein MshN